MSKIYYVLTNFKHDGTAYDKGTFVVSDEYAFTQLSAQNVLREMDAKTTDEAQAILDAEAAEAREQAAADEAGKPQDTWGPQTKAPENPAADASQPEVVADAAPMTEKYEVLKDFEVTNQDSRNYGHRKVGEVIEIEPAKAKAALEQGLIRLATDSVPTGDNL